MRQKAQQAADDRAIVNAPLAAGQQARAEAWEQVQRSEAADPRMLRALRQQQEFLQSQGVL